MDEKTQKIFNNYMSHTKKHIAEHGKEFSALKTMYHKLIKKDNVDPAFEQTKEIIKRMERDKLSAQSVMEMTEIMTPEIKGMKKDIIIMALPLILGIIIGLVFLILLSITRPFDFSNVKIIYFGIGFILGFILFLAGFLQRNKVKIKTLSTSMMYHACTAYGAAKMQGQGSFGAFRILDEMKNKQGKELQIRINQPKVVYKR